MFLELSEEWKMASTSGAAGQIPGASGPSGSGEGVFSQFMTEV